MKIDILNLEFIDETLRTIVDGIVKDTGLEFTITSLYRIGDSGVHGQLPLRGIDLRVWAYEIGLAIEKHINDRWCYDPKRPEKRCAILHDVGQGLHLHVQSHPNTILI